MNFISKNYRFKCENCSGICGLFFYIDKEEDFLKSSNIICEECFKKFSSNDTSDIKEEDKKENIYINKIKFKKENFKYTTIFNILNPESISGKDFLFYFKSKC